MPCLLRECFAVPFDVDRSFVPSFLQGKKVKVVQAKEDGTVDWNDASDVVTQAELAQTVRALRIRGLPSQIRWSAVALRIHAKQCFLGARIDVGMLGTRHAPLIGGLGAVLCCAVLATVHVRAQT